MSEHYNAKATVTLTMVEYVNLINAMWDAIEHNQVKGYPYTAASQRRVLDRLNEQVGDKLAALRQERINAA